MAELPIKIEIFKTFEINDDLWQQITEGFNECFNTNHTPEHFKEYYKSTVLGYSLHAVGMDDDGNLAGYNSYLPTKYVDRETGQEFLACVSGGTYVRKQYRKEFMLFHDLCVALRPACKSVGVKCILGVSNKNSFKYAVKINQSAHIGDLQYWMMPLRPSRVLKKPKLGFTDPVCRFAFWSIAKLSKGVSKIINTNEDAGRYDLVADDDFYDFRFYNKERYAIVDENNIKGAFRLCDEDGIKTVYLMDFREGGKRTYRALSAVVDRIMKMHPEVDAILFIGRLKMKQNLFVKVPHKFEPHLLPLTIKVLDREISKEEESQLKKFDNWNFSLVNFDAR